jgi:indole-3-glycerol phosphate synthase
VSVSNLARRRGTILDEIMRYHRQELPKTMREVPLENLRALVAVASPPLDMVAALENAPGVALIAECKKASPSRGLLIAHYDPAGLARDYARAGASAISVLTDGRHFQGSLAHLRDVKEALLDAPAMVTDKGDRRRQLGIPVLRKDFIFHPYQLFEARAAGADAVLLIAAVLSDNDLAGLMSLAAELGMAALVEAHTAEEVERILPHRPRLVGINNRNLQTFEVDFANSERLRALIPTDVLVVAESGIKTADDVRHMKAIGVKAILVGESLARSKNGFEAARDLVRAGRS